MLKIETAKQHLREVSEELARLDKDREALIGLVRHYEEFLRLRTGESSASSNGKPIAPVAGRIVKASVRRGKTKMSKSDAILLVLRAAHGAELHAQEVASRIGAYVSHKVNEKQPWRTGLDFQFYKLREEGLIDKVPGKNAWRAVTDYA